MRCSFITIKEENASSCKVCNKQETVILILRCEIIDYAILKFIISYFILDFYLLFANHIFFYYFYNTKQ